MFLLSNITQPEMATYGCYEINTWVSGYPSLRLVADSVSPTFSQQVLILQDHDVPLETYAVLS